MFFIKKSMAALGFSLALAGSAHAVTLSYGKVDAATFEQAVAAYRDDPDLSG